MQGINGIGILDFVIGIFSLQLGLERRTLGCLSVRWDLGMDSSTTVPKFVHQAMEDGTHRAKDIRNFFGNGLEQTNGPCRATQFGFAGWQKGENMDAYLEKCLPDIEEEVLDAVLVLVLMKEDEFDVCVRAICAM